MSWTKAKWWEKNARRQLLLFQQPKASIFPENIFLIYISDIVL